MKNFALRSSLFALALAASATNAFAYGGTSDETIFAAGSFSYEPSTASGTAWQIEARGGYYLFGGFAVGGSGVLCDDDATSFYEVSAFCQYHLLRLVNPENDSPWGFSPYAAARIGLAHGKNDYGDDDTGAVLAVRFGAEIFFTENVALDVSADLAACTGDVYPDESRLKGSDVSIRAGLAFHF